MASTANVHQGQGFPIFSAVVPLVADFAAWDSTAFGNAMTGGALHEAAVLLSWQHGQKHMNVNAHFRRPAAAK